MKLKNVLIVTEDIERSKKFYKDLFGLDVVLDNDGNVILTEGLALQDKKTWKSLIHRDVVCENNAAELYFEEKDIEGFVERLDAYEMPVVYVNKLTRNSRGRNVVRFYDPDGNLIEVGTPA